MVEHGGVYLALGSGKSTLPLAAQPVVVGA